MKRMSPPAAVIWLIIVGQGAAGCGTGEKSPNSMRIGICDRVVISSGVRFPKQPVSSWIIPFTLQADAVVQGWQPEFGCSAALIGYEADSECPTKIAPPNFLESS